jgi:hypothetical protein
MSDYDNSLRSSRPFIIESDNPFTPRQKAAQLKLISEIFAVRNFHLVVDRGALVSLAFADPPTKH